MQTSQLMSQLWRVCKVLKLKLYLWGLFGVDAIVLVVAGGVVVVAVAQNALKCSCVNVCCFCWTNNNSNNNVNESKHYREQRHNSRETERIASAEKHQQQNSKTPLAKLPKQRH